MKIAAVIPARYASVRFPGKALALLHGKPIVLRCVEQVKQCRCMDEVIVATDDERIARVVREAGHAVAMTSPDCATGSDRVAEVVRARGNDWDIIVNVQGDEPYIDPGVVDSVARALAESPDCGVATAMVRFKTKEDFLSPHNVKAVAAPDGRALYFSRSPIPSIARLTDAEIEAPDFCWGHKHLGLYAYRRETLLEYTQWPQTPLEKRERLEQLRLMERGVGIKLVEVAHDSIGVDTPEELEQLSRAESLAGV